MIMLNLKNSFDRILIRQIVLAKLQLFLVLFIGLQSSYQIRWEFPVRKMEKSTLNIIKAINKCTAAREREASLQNYLILAENCINLYKCNWVYSAIIYRYAKSSPDPSILKAINPGYKMVYNIWAGFIKILNLRKYGVLIYCCNYTELFRIKHSVKLKS